MYSSSQRSLRVAPEQIERVKRKRKSSSFARYQDLADATGLSRSTITNFFNGIAIDRLNFIEICPRLGLDWQEIADGELPDPKELRKEDLTSDLEINTLVEEIRHKCYEKMVLLYGKIQLLDISQPIDLNNCYVEVNILEQISSEQHIDISNIDFNPAPYDPYRLNIGRVRHQRLFGLAAVERYSRLMILGKPGSGKTTFLQHLAIQCIEGNFRTDLVPIFIRLKNFAKYTKDQQDFKLFNYICREFQNCDIKPDQVETLLNQGRGLILLDGLDEVPYDVKDEIVDQIRQFSEDYFQNQLIITCRIAAQKYRFLNFTYVEVADFNEEQIKSFANKWFVVVARKNPNYGRVVASQFIDKLLHRPINRPIRELAVTPILLHLTCLVFQAKAEFPSNRAKLYEQGLDILLKRWDEARGIRDRTYRDLTLPQKKQLLAQVAATTFKQGDYFFDQETVKQLIADYLRSLSADYRSSTELESDSEAILKSIESQHGLFVERAKGIYSFSHLTFQEYFTARHLIDSLEPNVWNQLGCQIVDKRWREVLLLALEMCKNADFLLQVIKEQVDGLVADDDDLQQFLVWLNQLPLSRNIRYKPAAVRAFYFALDIALDRHFDDSLEIALDIALERGIDPALVPAFPITLDTVVVPAPSTALDMAINIALDTALIPALDIALRIALVRALNPGYNLSLNIRNINRALKRALVRVHDPKLRHDLQDLKEQLPTTNSHEMLKQWWQVNGQGWTEHFKQVMIEHRHIGHYWQFNREQRDALKQYYDANKLLVDCLNSGCNVTSHIREEIEETLFLPKADIEPRVR